MRDLGRGPLVGRHQIQAVEEAGDSAPGPRVELDRGVRVHLLPAKRCTAIGGTPSEVAWDSATKLPGASWSV